MKKFMWVIPVVIAFCTFSVSYNNFFVYDDFIWLYRAKTLGQNWLQMFYPDVTYFDPLIYLMFLVDSIIAGFDPRWYHAVDLTIHAFNSFLIYRFGSLLSGDEKTALYGSILFASSFTIADAILWSSSRVDLVSVMFSLGVLIQFLKYLRTNNSRYLWLSFCLFVLALGAKGTPLVIPLVLFWLIVQEKKPLSHAVHLVPFGAVILLYFFLLKLTMNRASLPLDKLHFNLRNLELALCTLFIPEGVLIGLGLLVTTAVLFVVVSALGLAAAPLTPTITLRRTGYCILLAAIVPVLAVTDFKLVTQDSNPYLLLLSPSHRIYLASVGVALLLGGLVRSIEMLLKNSFPKCAAAAVVMILAGAVTGNAFLVRERDQLWESSGKWSRDCFEGLLTYRHQVSEGSQIGLINFPGSRGFTTPMAKLCLDISDLSILKEVTTGMIEDPEILRKAEKSHLFILGGDKRVYDKSQLYRQLLTLNRTILLNRAVPENRTAYQEISSQLYWNIQNITALK